MISYHFENTDFVFRERELNNRWLRTVAESEMKRIGDIAIIFCSDGYLLDVNRKYLGHDYFTDIITFDYCEGERLSGDLFISVDSVRENAVEYDHTEEDVKTMREKENQYLEIRSHIL